MKQISDTMPSKKMIKHIVSQYPKLPFPNLWEMEVIAKNFLLAFFTIFVGWGTQLFGRELRCPENSL